MRSNCASAPASPLLCRTCRSIFQNDFKEIISYPKNWIGNSNDRKPDDPSLSDPPAIHQASAASLQQAVLQNCFFCSAISKKLPSEMNADTSSGFTSYFIRHDDMDFMRGNHDDNEYLRENVTIKNYIRLTFMLGSGSGTKSENILLEYILFRTNGKSILTGSNSLKLTNNCRVRNVYEREESLGQYCIS